MSIHNCYKVGDLVRFHHEPYSHMWKPNELGSKTYCVAGKQISVPEGAIGTVLEPNAQLETGHSAVIFLITEPKIATIAIIHICLEDYVVPLELKENGGV